MAVDVAADVVFDDENAEIIGLVKPTHNSCRTVTRRMQKVAWQAFGWYRDSRKSVTGTIFIDLRQTQHSLPDTIN